MHLKGLQRHAAAQEHFQVNPESLTCREVDAAEPFIQLTNGSVVPSNNYNFFEIDAQATITGGSAGPGGSLRSSFRNQAPAAKCASEPKPGSRQQGWQIQVQQDPAA